MSEYNDLLLICINTFDRNLNQQKKKNPFGSVVAQMGKFNSMLAQQARQ